MSSVTSVILIVPPERGIPIEKRLAQINAFMAKNYEPEDELPVTHAGQFVQVKDCCLGGTKGMGAELLTCGANYLNWERFIEEICELNWCNPDDTQVLFNREYRGETQFYLSSISRLKDTYCTCRRCGLPFLVTFEFRKNRRFCTDACRMADMRDRQAKARQLVAGGMTFGEAAKELGVSKVSVRVWVTGAKRRKGDRYYRKPRETQTKPE